MFVSLVVSLLIGSPAYALFGPSTKVVERERVLGSEAVSIGECLTVAGNIPLIGHQVRVVVAERLKIETYMVSVSYEGFGRGVTEQMIGGSGRVYDVLETYTKKFGAPSGQAECAAFVTALRKNPSLRFNALPQGHDSERVGAQ